MHEIKLNDSDVDTVKFCILNYRFQVLREAQSQRAVDRRNEAAGIGFIGDSTWSYEYAERLQELANRIAKQKKPRRSLLDKFFNWVFS